MFNKFDRFRRKRVDNQNLPNFIRWRQVVHHIMDTMYHLRITYFYYFSYNLCTGPVRSWLSALFTGVEEVHRSVSLSTSLGFLWFHLGRHCRSGRDCETVPGFDVTLLTNVINRVYREYKIVDGIVNLWFYH